MTCVSETVGEYDRGGVILDSWEDQRCTVSQRHVGGNAALLFESQLLAAALCRYNRLWAASLYLVAGSPQVTSYKRMECR